MRCALQIVEFPDAEGPLEFSYDEEWLAVLRATHSRMSLSRAPVTLPAGAPAGVAPQDVQAVRELLAAQPGGARVPDNFAPTAPAHAAGALERMQGTMPRVAVRNPQTEALLALLGLSYNLDQSQQRQQQQYQPQQYQQPHKQRFAAGGAGEAGGRAGAACRGLSARGWGWQATWFGWWAGRPGRVQAEGPRRQALQFPELPLPH